jgi:hypothetical protein
MLEATMRNKRTMTQDVKYETSCAEAPVEAIHGHVLRLMPPEPWWAQFQPGRVQFGRPLRDRRCLLIVQMD